MCAFCPQEGKLSSEHLWSAWMDDLIPGKKKFTSWNEKGEVARQWLSDDLDWTAKVVCKTCNETWMSKIESQHAKPAMTDLIRGKTDVPISQSRADSIAFFAFKTALLFDYIQRNRAPFFGTSVRHCFRESLGIPVSVSMWMAGFVPAGKGEIHTCYHEGNTSSTNHLKLYVCTYAIGHFVFQVLAYRRLGFKSIRPRDKTRHLVVPFWPRIPQHFIWPPAHALATVNELNAFSVRWQEILFQS
jgi:hypothetical protein